MKAWACLALSLRRLWRQARAGEYRLLLAALILAAASSTGVERLVARASLILGLEVRELLAADRALRSTEPIEPARIDIATQLGLRTSRTAQFRSMLVAKDRFVLADLKAVDASYPLRGRLDMHAPGAAGGPAVRVHRAPQPGEVWLAPDLAERLEVVPGATIRLGDLDQRFAGYLEHEPDRGSDFLGLAPRALMAWADLAPSGLLGPGSRVNFRLLAAGPGTALAAWTEAITPTLRPHEAWVELEREQGAVRHTLERARQFLGLASLTVVLVSALAVAFGAEGLARRQRRALALLRCWGASRREIFGLLLVEILGLGLVAAVLGTVLGMVLETTALALLLPQAYAELPLSPWTGWTQGLKVTVLTLLVGAGPPLLTLAHVAPAEVLRLRATPRRAGAALLLGGLILACALLPWGPGTRGLSAWMLAGLLALSLGLSGLGLGLVRLARPLSLASGGALRQGLASLSRRSGAVLQLVALGLGMSLMLVLTLVQDELFASWRQTLAKGTPNHFLINIQPAEVAAVHQRLRDAGVAMPELYPMIRGRLTAIDGNPLDPARLPEGRARQLAEREFNLSIAPRPQRDNHIIAGDFWPAGPGSPPQFSAEAEIAGLLGFGLGQELQFSVAGKPVSARVTSLRKVQWDSFNVNFFVVAPPGLLEGLPQTWVTSFHLPPERRAAFSKGLLDAHPSVSLIDVEAQLATLQGLVTRAGQALSGVFVLALLAAALVLLAALALTEDERQRETDLLMALGATRARLIRSTAVEFAALGALAGLGAAIAAALMGEAIAVQVFELHYQPGLALWLLGPGLGVITVLAIGLAGTRTALATPPARILALDL